MPKIHVWHFSTQSTRPWVWCEFLIFHFLFCAHSHRFCTVTLGRRDIWRHNSYRHALKKEKVLGTHFLGTEMTMSFIISFKSWSCTMTGSDNILLNSCGRVWGSLGYPGSSPIWAANPFCWFFFYSWLYCVTSMEPIGTLIWSVRSSFSHEKFWIYLNLFFILLNFVLVV